MQVVVKGTATLGQPTAWADTNCHELSKMTGQLPRDFVNFLGVLFLPRVSSSEEGCHSLP